MIDDCWSLPEIGWPELRVHPMHLIDDEDFQLIRLWRLYDHGHGPLPEAGGALDQSSAILAAFDILDVAAAALTPKHHG